MVRGQNDRTVTATKQNKKQQQLSTRLLKTGHDKVAEKLLSLGCLRFSADIQHGERTKQQKQQ